MGFWNDGIRTGSRSRSRSRSGSRSPSRAHSNRAGSRSSSKHYTSKPAYNRSVSSFFSIGGGSGGGGSQSGGPRGGTSRGRSYTSARPRSGFVARVRRILRQIYEYMRKHPIKVFMLVIMPLITGGVLTKLLHTVGIKLPRSVENMMGSSMNRGVSQSERFYARGGARDFGGGAAMPGIGDSIQSALSIAKMFM